MLRIKQISEAFSLQPNEKHVSTDWELTQKIPHIKAIELLTLEISKEEKVSFYIGYNFDNQIVFQWIAKACNVEYFEE